MNWRHGGIALTLLVGGCTLGPDYQRPELPMPEAYLQTADEGASIANLPWWELFLDPQLRSLIETALEENKNLAIAAARVEEARAQLGITRADQFPNVNAGTRAERGNTAELINEDLGTNTTLTVGASLAWELDIWGKLRRATEAARAQLLATEEAQRAVTISLIGDVASAYLLLRDLDDRLAIAERTMKSREEYLVIIQARYNEGTVPLIDVNQADVELADAQVTRSAIERQVVNAENTLSILLGRNPSTITRGQTLDQQVFPPALPIGVPAELLARRPDIRQAEQALAAQTARIGVAEANRLPSLNVLGQLGFVDSNLDDLFDTDLWTIGGELSGPLFDAGRTKQQVEVELARTEQLLNQYGLQVQLALREVEDALAAIRTYNAELKFRERQVQSARSAATLSRARYDGGVTSYLEVLDSERSQFDTELAESVTRRASLDAVVQLYKALGGGWQPQP
ncbi:MAG: efflux transporter outer membrane subunit [Chromatiales bacterium]|nr:MAG: efflux transporter outer membrane subunit [Chromatiales bacterium]